MNLNLGKKFQEKSKLFFNHIDMGFVVTLLNSWSANLQTSNLHLCHVKIDAIKNLDASKISEKNFSA